jgi:hypothetical protein
MHGSYYGSRWISGGGWGWFWGLIYVDSYKKKGCCSRWMDVVLGWKIYIKKTLLMCLERMRVVSLTRK